MYGEFKRNEKRAVMYYPSILWKVVLLSGFSPWRPPIRPSVVHEGFVADKMAMGHIFLRALLFSPTNHHSANPPRPSLIRHGIPQYQVILSRSTAKIRKIAPDSGTQMNRVYPKYVLRLLSLDHMFSWSVNGIWVCLFSVLCLGLENFKWRDINGLAGEHDSSAPCLFVLLTRPSFQQPTSRWFIALGGRVHNIPEYTPTHFLGLSKANLMSTSSTVYSYTKATERSPMERSPSHRFSLQHIHPFSRLRIVHENACSVNDLITFVSDELWEFWHRLEEGGEG